jgi:16S rRNA (adenine1518-N6/adenine1519-N6)-dimethyltransferase
VSVAEVRAVLERHGLAAHRDRGQNFLVSHEIAERLVTHAGVDATDAVIEIGPGLGILTRALAARAARVVALEIDAGLMRVLQQDAALPSNVSLQHVDALDVDLAALARSLGSRVRVVANLPYAVSSPILRRLLDARSALLDWSVMLQREVAERVLAAPGEPGYGSLAVLHALTVTGSRGLELAPSDFFPAPRVRSRFFRLTPRHGDGSREDALDDQTLLRVERVARAAFGQRRKQLANALRGGLRPLSAEVVLQALVACDIDPRARAEALAPAAFLAIARALGPAADA